jgi:hypothetical protein
MAVTSDDELEREVGVQPPDGTRPRDGELAADVLEALRSSGVVAGDRVRVRAGEPACSFGAASPGSSDPIAPATPDPVARSVA